MSAWAMGTGFGGARPVPLITLLVPTLPLANLPPQPTPPPGQHGQASPGLLVSQFRVAEGADSHDHLLG